MNRERILFTDLDDTLLRKDKSVSPRCREAIFSMLSAGNKFAIATGRNIESAKRVAAANGFTRKGCYLVAYNGAVLYDFSEEQVLEEKTLSFEDLSYLFSEAKKYGLYIQTYYKEYMVTDSPGQELSSYYATHTNTPVMEVEDVLSWLPKPPNKALLISLDNPNLLERFRLDHLAWEKGRANSLYSCPEYLEYCPPDTDKGTGIRRMCQLLSIPMEQAYAAGDERNDVAMLKAAGTGIAVANARKEAKAAADFITQADHEHDAIAEIIEHFGLNRPV